jgi:exoribonuclease R
MFFFVSIIEAFVRLEEKSPLGRDIFIPNITLRNRAIHGDIVAVELIDKKFWRFSNTLNQQFPEDEDNEYEQNIGTRFFFVLNYRNIYIYIFIYI